MEHLKDSDCTVDPVTMLCTECGVDHSEECLACHGRGFHNGACIHSDYVQEFLAAQLELITAAFRLAAAWEDGADFCDGYPAGLPSFGVFAHQLAAWMETTRTNLTKGNL